MILKVYFESHFTNWYLWYEIGFRNQTEDKSTFVQMMVWCRPAISWVSVDPDLCRYICVTIGHNVLNARRAIFQPQDKKTKKTVRMIHIWHIVISSSVNPWQLNQPTRGFLKIGLIRFHPVLPCMINSHDAVLFHAELGDVTHIFMDINGFFLLLCRPYRDISIAPRSLCY